MIKLKLEYSEESTSINLTADNSLEQAILNEFIDERVRVKGASNGITIKKVNDKVSNKLEGPYPTSNVNKSK